MAKAVVLTDDEWGLVLQAVTKLRRSWSGKAGSHRERAESELQAARYAVRKADAAVHGEAAKAHGEDAEHFAARSQAVAALRKKLEAPENPNLLYLGDNVAATIKGGASVALQDEAGGQMGALIPNHLVDFLAHCIRSVHEQEAASQPGQGAEAGV
jgi:dsDNA-specific endonuclease/ATPase MutS2